MALYVEPGLERKRPKHDWGTYAVIVFFLLSMLFAAYASYVAWHTFPHAHAAERTFSAVVKGGTYMTPAEFCRTQV